MAKRQRGSRPGQRPPTQRAGTKPGPNRPAARPAVPSRPASSLTDEELSRAAELEERILAEERAATDARSRGRDRRRFAGSMDASLQGRSRLTGTLAVVAPEEYRYVTRDLRRIAVVFGSIFGLLAVLFLLTEVLHVAG